MNALLQPPDNPPPATLDKIVPTPQASQEAGHDALELETRQAALDATKIHNAGLAKYFQQREDWGDRVFWMLVGWLVSVVAVLVLDGFHVHGFHLDNSIMIAFIGTTTADVLGLGYVVANFLFPKPS